MSPAASKIMTTVNAPYGARLSARQLAERIADLKSADEFDCSVFAFLSDVSPDLQRAFITEMAVNEAAVAAVARKFSALAGYKLALAR